MKKFQKHYLGIDLLRMILQFFIVIHHTSDYSTENNIFMEFNKLYLSFYTSSFFLMSFYFSFRLFNSFNITKIKERLFRISFPYIVWPIIELMRLIFLSIVYKDPCLNIKNIFSDLLKQYILGNKIYIVFWFQNNLIITSILFLIIIFLFKNKYMIVFIIVVVNIIIFNYFTCHNIDFRRTINHSVRMLFKTFIYSLTGFVLGSYNILNKLNNNNLIIKILFPTVYCIKNYKKIAKIFGKFDFIFLDTLISIIFIIFGCIPFHKTNNYIIILLTKITSFTGGIYYIHLEIWQLLDGFPLTY